VSGHPKLPRRETKIARDRTGFGGLFWRHRARESMHPVVALLLSALAAYAAAGLVTAVAFVAFGVTRVQPAPVSVGARLLILPGAAALWPYVLMRWLRARSAP
jgi:hypothetical protein